MKKSAKLKKIVWALDALEEGALQLKIASFLRPISEKLEIDVEPVFVFSLSGIPGSIDREGLLTYLPRVEENLRKMIKKSNFKNLKSEKIIIQSKMASIRNDVKALLAYAQKNEAQAIVVSTHAKKGMSRLFMGSFAETLLLNSNIPVIVVNPASRLHWKSHAIMFVTDFSSGSLQAFNAVLSLAASLKSKIILFHQNEGEEEKVESNVFVIKKTGLRPVDTILLSKELGEAKKKSKEWQRLAKSQGVLCTTHFEYGLRNIAESAIHCAKKLQVDMIALASKKGPIATALIGSTTRWIVRGSPCPVWVLHVKS